MIKFPSSSELGFGTGVLLGMGILILIQDSFKYLLIPSAFIMFLITIYKGYKESKY